jgi:hypothetical protein
LTRAVRLSAALGSARRDASTRPGRGALMRERLGKAFVGLKRSSRVSSRGFFKTTMVFESTSNGSLRLPIRCWSRPAPSAIVPLCMGCADAQPGIPASSAAAKASTISGSSGGATSGSAVFASGVTAWMLGAWQRSLASASVRARPARSPSGACARRSARWNEGVVISLR